MKNPICIFSSFFLLAILITHSACAQDGNTLAAADALYAQHNWKAAKESYVEYLKDTSVNVIAWNHLAVCNHNLGFYDEAVKNYSRALSYNPPSQIKNIIEARLARTYAAMNQQELAFEWLDKATVSGYTNLKDIDTLADFNKIRNTERFAAIYKKIYARAFPCTQEPHSKDFDFWIGEWDVYVTNTRTLVGHSIVQPISGGCGILENWASAGNPNGKSLNYYDPAAGKWEQDWIGSGGDLQHYLNGEYADNKMRFTYNTTTNGQMIHGNFIFYNIDKDTVRQYQDVIDKDGKILKVSYDFTYIRKK